MLRNFSTLRPTGISYIIEVNGNPGTKIIDITGHNYFNDLVDYIESKVSKSKNVENDNQPASTSAVSGKSWLNAPWNQSFTSNNIK